MNFLYMLTVIIALMVSIPLLFVALQLLISQLKISSTPWARQIENPRLLQETSYKILIPAHDEAAVISETLNNLLVNGVPAAKILVVVDNCSDNTAELVSQANVGLTHRLDSLSRGKGFALNHGIRKMAINHPPDIVVVLDADSCFKPGGLSSLLETCLAENSPTQAIYLMRSQPYQSIKLRLAAFAWLVKNWLRPLAMDRLKMPVILTGTGMAFPWEQIVNLNLATENLVEDMQMGIDLTLKNTPPVLCETAFIESEFPEHKHAIDSQRKRWEHGHLAIILGQCPSLLAKALKRGDIKLFGFAMDLAVPPLALLILISLFSVMLVASVAVMTGKFVPLIWIGSSLTVFSFTILSVWFRFGRVYLSGRDICHIPFYVFSKLWLYISFFIKRQKSWVKTDRSD